MNLPFNLSKQTLSSNYLLCSSIFIFSFIISTVFKRLWRVDNIFFVCFFFFALIYCSHIFFSIFFIYRKAVILHHDPKLCFGFYFLFFYSVKKRISQFHFGSLSIMILSFFLNTFRLIFLLEYCSIPPKVSHNIYLSLNHLREVNKIRIEIHQGHYSISSW